LGPFTNSSSGNIIISDTDSIGIDNFSNQTFSNHGAIELKSFAETHLLNKGIIENQNLIVIIGSSSSSNALNLDSIYNGPNAVFKICCNDGAGYGFENSTLESALTNEGLVDVDGSQPIGNEGRIINNASLIVEDFNSTGIFNTGIIINTDSLTVKGGWTGIYIEESSSEIGFKNEGYCSFSNLGGAAIDMTMGEAYNSGTIQISELGKGIEIEPNSSTTTLFHNLAGANISISEARDYGVRLAADASFINESSALLHIMDTDDIPLSIDSSATLEGFHDLIIED